MPGQTSRYASKLTHPSRYNISSRRAKRRANNAQRRSAIRHAEYTDNYSKEQIIKIMEFLYANADVKDTEADIKTVYDYQIEKMLLAFQDYIHPDSLPGFYNIKARLLRLSVTGLLTLYTFFIILITDLHKHGIQYLDNIRMDRLFSSKNESGRVKGGIITLAGDIAKVTGKALVAVAPLNSSGRISALGHGLQCVGEECKKANAFHSIVSGAMKGNHSSFNTVKTIVGAPQTNTQIVGDLMARRNASATVNAELPPVPSAESSGGRRRKTSKYKKLNRKTKKSRTAH